MTLAEPERPSDLRSMTSPYRSRFLKGEQVRIESRERLLEFQFSWQLHHPLTAEQVEYADRVAKVADVSFFHGGDVLYSLEGVPGIWHEGCLR